MTVGITGRVRVRQYHHRSAGRSAGTGRIGARLVFEVEVTAQDGWSVLMPIGDLDMASAPALRRHLIEAIGATGGQVVIDMAGVHFVDSQGLGTLVAGLKRARTHGGDLRLTGVSGAVADLLVLTSLDRAFVVAADVEAATGPLAPIGPSYD
jgi:anti-sigma B factor antagonist